MTSEREIEGLLEKGRLSTTEELDGRVLGASAKALRRRGLIVWLGPAVAAAVLLLVVGGTMLSSGGPDARPEPEVDLSDLELIDVSVRNGAPLNGRIELTFSESLDPDAGETVRLTGDQPVTVLSLGTMRIQGALDGNKLRRELAAGYRFIRFHTTYSIEPETYGDVTVAPGEESGHDREGYDALVENDYLDPRRDPLSTFSVDVDTASYANVRRLLNEGKWPPAGAVRIEEMLNAFSYALPGPTDGRPFAVAAEVSSCPWNTRHRLVRLGVQGRRIDESQIPPRNLVFLLDVSGSMDEPAKLPLVKQALRMLVERLRPSDSVGIVVYAGASGVVLEPTSDRAAIQGALERLGAGGSTNGGEGIRLAYDLARRHLREEAINRVILATDGDFNVGVTNRSDLLKLIEKEREGGVFLTVLGVGTGNVQDSQMEMLADHGNGNYAYLDSRAEAEKVLVREAGGTLMTIAKDVKIQVEFNPRKVEAYRLIGYENRALAARDFADDKKDAGEIGAGHSVTALYEIVPAGEPAETGEVAPLKYQTPAADAGPAFANEILTVKLRWKEPRGTTSRLFESPLPDPGPASIDGASDDQRFAAAVAAFAMVLRESRYRGESNLPLVHELASGALGEDPHGDRAGFLRLVAKAEQLSNNR